MVSGKKAAKSANTSVAATRFNLSDLQPACGSVKEKTRVGRGRGSGKGKTSSRGHNGEGQRSGLSSKRGFEGGQMPLYRRLPHIDGFELVNRRRWFVLNVKDLSDYLLPDEEELTYEKLEELGFYNSKRYDGVRILGNGDLKRKITVEAHHVTPSARQKIEASGGQIKLRNSV